MDTRKVKLRALKKKLEKLALLYPDINMNDIGFRRAVIDYDTIDKEAFYLEFEINYSKNEIKKLAKFRKENDKSI